jgi:hypothetical protein
MKKTLIIKSIFLLAILSVSTYGLGVKHNTNNIDTTFYGIYFQDLQLKACSGADGFTHTVTVNFDVPASVKNFKQVDEMMKQRIAKFVKDYPQGICELSYVTDLINKNGKKLSCHVKLNQDRIAMNETVLLPSKEFCK